MSFIYELELTQTTLLALFIIPFFYFGYHAKFYWNPKKLKTFDFFLKVICIVLGVIIFLKLAYGSKSFKPQSKELLFLHIAPLILTLLIIAQGKKAAAQPKSALGSGKGTSEGFAPVPLNDEIQHLSWDELIIDNSLKAELISVIQLLKDPKTTKKYGIEVPKGILLNGPPGTGKTTIAKVIASTANLSFFVLQTDEIVSKWVGESEKNLSLLFDAALSHAPAVIFIDEVDSIGKKRGSGAQAYADNLVNHLLQLIDGVVATEGLYIIAATNRADLVDAALKRAGRLNKVIEVPLPDYRSRIKLFQLYMSRLKLANDINLEVLAELTNGKSAADIKEICNQAGLNAFKRESSGKKRDYQVTVKDIEYALREFMAQQG